MKMQLAVLAAMLFLTVGVAAAHDDRDHETHNVPEPSSILMLASGLVGIGAFVRFRK